MNTKKLTLEIVQDFVKEEISKSNRPNYSFRSRYRHTLRVLRWVRELHTLVGGDLEVLEYAALLHDCSWNGNENHAITSHEVAKKFLSEFDLPTEKREKILEAVLYHNRDFTEGLHHESYIVMDADELDELGAITIIWDALSEGQLENSSYDTVYERIIKYNEEHHQRIERMHFDETRIIYQSRLDVIDNFIKELEYELGIKKA